MPKRWNVKMSSSFKFNLLIISFIEHQLLRLRGDVEGGYWTYKAFSALRAHLLFQFLIVALSVSIFSSCTIENNNKKVCRLNIIFCAFSKFNKKKKLLDTNFGKLRLHKPSLGSCEVPHKIWVWWFFFLSANILQR